MARLTPMMQQYLQIKEQYKDALLFFRLGDFYEMFFEDAKIASKELEITLTGRDCGLEQRAPMCGIPYHSAEGYIGKLIEKGYKVAICEQLQDPSEAKGIVERDVVRIITPGTLLESSMLDEKSNNYIVSIYKDGMDYGVSATDISTGEFLISQITGDKTDNRLLDEIIRIHPREIIVNEELHMDQDLVHRLKESLASLVSPYHEWSYAYQTAYQKLLMHFNVHSLEGYGCQDMPHGICAAGALLEYLMETQKNALQHINRIKTYQPESYMVIDASAARNLELIETLRDKKKRGTLLWLLDRTQTAMGARLLKKWILQPLICKEEIDRRLEAVENMINSPVLMEELKKNLKKVYDLERLVARISYGNANARDMISLKQSLGVLPSIKDLLAGCHASMLRSFCQEIDLLDDVYLLIERSITDNPPVTVRDGGIIKEGFNQELDRYRQASSRGKEWIAELERKERERTGIKNLKVGFNKVFGYYLDVTKSYYDLVPDNYIRKQTLANSERFITPELKEVEDTILGAEEKSVRLEYQLFTDIRQQIALQAPRIQNTASIISALDVLLSLAITALENGYVRPELSNDSVIHIRDGRHPVVEKMLPHELFVPNHTYLDNDENRLMIITGPNMAGKSTYMRQVALIVLMAHIGSFVPATKAQICIVDRIFTRVGASDDLSAGRSTFMVEMAEVANILNNATNRSLLILDDSGRGTSTYDGLSIAWSVIEYICNNKELGSKTLFATHYHELTELEGSIPGVKNYCISVKEYGHDIVFLRKIVRGGTGKSLGIQVARLAGLPAGVIDRADEILKQLEDASINKLKKKTDNRADGKNDNTDSGLQMSFFDPVFIKIRDKLKEIDILSISPMEAMNILYELVQMAGEKDAF